MKKIRIGNDIDVTIKVTKDGLAEDLSDKVLRLILRRDTLKIEITDFILEGNTIQFTFKGTEQVYNGAYYVTLFEIDGSRQNVIDSFDVFDLVARSTDIGTDDCMNVTTDSVQLDLNIKTGDDSYEALQNKPSINEVTLTGNKTLDELGIASKDYVNDKIKEYIGEISNALDNINGITNGNN